MSQHGHKYRLISALLCLTLLLTLATPSFAQAPENTEVDARNTAENETGETASTEASSDTSSVEASSTESSSTNESSAASVPDAEPQQAPAPAHETPAALGNAAGNTAENAPRFAIVVIGESNAPLTEQAEHLGVLLAGEGLAQVDSQELRDVLLGNASPAHLEAVVSARETLSNGDSLGTSTEHNRALSRLSELTDVDALVFLVSGDSVRRRVFDTHAQQFFVDRTVSTTAGVARAVTAASERPTLALQAPAEAESEERPARAFMRRNWPYFVGGALLVAAIVWLVVGTGGDDTPQPVLNFGQGRL